MSNTQKQKFQHMKKGFSLAELLVVMAIVGIMTGVGITSLVGSKANKDLEAAAREVAAVIREAQNNALTGHQVDTYNACDFSVSGIGGSEEYNMKYSLSGDCSVSSQISSYSLRNGVIFAGNASIAFSLPRGGLTPTGGVDFVLTKSDAGKVIHVCVNSSGNITETAVNGVCP